MTKQRWALRRSCTLRPGMLVWFGGHELVLTKVSVNGATTLVGSSQNSAVNFSADFPKDVYVAVKIPSPPALPAPPITRYISDHGNASANAVWLTRLGTWLNGR